MEWYQSSAVKIEVVYIYPNNGRGRESLCGRFRDSYLANPAGLEHELVIVNNGEALNENSRNFWAGINGHRFLDHDNSGWDIGAFQHAARESQADLMVYFGVQAYLRRPDWLKRMVQAMDTYGPNALYGSMQVSQSLQPGVWPHIRTTGFWLPPKIMAQYPHRVTEPGQRYPFEHGPDSLTMWCARNYGCYSATFAGLYDMNHWHEVVEGYRWGNQKELLTGDRMTCPPYYPVP